MKVLLLNLAAHLARFKVAAVLKLPALQFGENAQLANWNTARQKAANRNKVTDTVPTAQVKRVMIALNI